MSWLRSLLGQGFDHAEGRAVALDSTQHQRIEELGPKAAMERVRTVPQFVFVGDAAINGGAWRR